MKKLLMSLLVIGFMTSLVPSTFAAPLVFCYNLAKEKLLKGSTCANAPNLPRQCTAMGEQQNDGPIPPNITEPVTWSGPDSSGNCDPSSPTSKQHFYNTNT